MEGVPTWLSALWSATDERTRGVFLDPLGPGWFARVPRIGDGDVLFLTWCRIVRHKDGMLVVSVPGEADQSVSLRNVHEHARQEAPPMHVEVEAACNAGGGA